MTDESDILRNIDELIDEEHALRARATKAEGLSEQEKERLHAVEVLLDQCWDLLRQRRARAEFGQDPSGARPRPVEQVERYQS
jgi:Protein of unknown function (DUF2630)